MQAEGSEIELHEEDEPNTEDDQMMTETSAAELGASEPLGVRPTHQGGPVAGRIEGYLSYRAHTIKYYIAAQTSIFPIPDLHVETSKGLFDGGITMALSTVNL